MMDVLKEWISPIISAMLLISLAEQLIPEGALRKVAAFISGIVLLVVVLQPIPKIREIDWDLRIKEYRKEFEENKRGFQNAGIEMLSEEVAEKTAEVIEQRAEIYGEAVAAVVETTVNEQGIPIPTAARIYGRYQEELSNWIEAALGISPDMQKWILAEEKVPP